MPNWCNNRLYVTGDETQLNLFKKAVYSETPKASLNPKVTFNFNGTIPMPNELIGTVSPVPVGSEKKAKELKQKYGHSNWHDWQKAYWGVKWGACKSYEIESITNGFLFQYITPWCPAHPWLINTARMFPLLVFQNYGCEEGNDYYDCITIVNGVDVPLEDWSRHDWLMRFDEDYQKEFVFITEGKIDEVVQDCCSVGELSFEILEVYLFERLREVDLPLFINFNWINMQDQYETRLKNLNKEEVLS